MAHTILAVDDDPVQRRLAEAALSRAGHAVVQAEDGESALDLLSSPRGKEISGVLLDLVMPGMNGLAVLKEMRARGQEQPVIVQTAQGSIDTVIAAMRAGAFDFVVKPAAPDRLAAAFAGALKVNALAGKARKAARPGQASITFKDIVTRSTSMDRVLTLARKAAGSMIPIMIEGESGTGKELLARAIQGAGERAAQPFVTVNCGAIPENLVESILFGHEKGSFTGATEKHQGKFVEANHGTLFLDEIGDLPLEAQVKLLRAVQEGEVDAVGAARSQKVDIRLISATHRDLMQAVRDGDFREDLYYRLNVFPIRMPPLRERREDIPFLVSHFIKRHAQTEGNVTVSGISTEALQLLMAYDWPGNIRQLENAIFRAVVLADRAELGTEEFPQIRTQVEGVPGRGIEIALSDRRGVQTMPDLVRPRVPEPPVFVEERPQSSDEACDLVRALDAKGHVRPLADIELDMIRLAINHYEGQMSEVARRLGIGRSTLYRKLKEYGIEPEAERAPRVAS